MAETTNRIKKIGNGHFLPLSAALMAEADLRAGQEVKIASNEGGLVVRAIGDNYTATRASAGKMVDRYRRALVKLGREGDTD